MKSVSVDLQKIQDVTISGKLKDGVWLSKIAFEGEFNITDLSRILNLVRQGAAIDVNFTSQQAEFDLNVTEVSVGTGEAK